MKDDKLPAWKLWFKKYYYLKICYNRAHNYISIPKNIITDIIGLSILFKVYGVTSYLTYLPFFLVVMAVVVFIGHLDVKHKLAHMETEVNNKLNPQIMALYEKLMEDKNGKSKN